LASVSVSGIADAVMCWNLDWESTLTPLPA
jgi:hypothetical protein